MKTKAEGKIILKEWMQIVVLTLGIIGALFSLVLIIQSFNKENPQNELYNYNYNSNLNYRVYLKQNEFFKEPYIGMNKEYITSLIDKIEAEFKYNFKSSKDLNYTYSYEINAIPKAFYSENTASENEVWQQIYPLYKSEILTATGNTISINQTVPIDYNVYNNLMNSFKNRFGVSIESRVDIECKINIIATLNDKTSKEANEITLQIPLLKQTTKFTPNYTNHGNKVVYDDTKEAANVNIFKLIFGLVILGLSIYIIKTFIKKLKTTTKKSEYIFKLNKILKEYGDIIAESTNLPDLSKYDVVSIKDFKDMVDIEEELHAPIICTEIRQNLETWFMILYDKTAYRYILKYEDFGKK